MAIETDQAKACQIDFYVLGEGAPEAAKLACRLALMAWEQKHQIFVVTANTSAAKQVDSLMWRYPEGRFLPHSMVGDADAGKVPVHIGTLSDLNPVDVVINLCPEAVPQPDRFSRLLEIVPYAESERHASRVKFKTYRNLGLDPQKLEINT